jgi:hypothetical protein
MILEMRQIEFLYIRPIKVISRFGELFRPGVDVQSVGQALTQSFHVSANPVRSLQDCDIMATAGQLVSAAKARDPTAGNDYLLSGGSGFERGPEKK